MLKICRIQGISMSPIFNEGDYVLAIKKRFLKPTIGDYILFRSQTFGCIIKRITKQNKEGFYVEGINKHSMNSSTLGIVPPEKIIGKVVLRLPRRQSS